MPVVTATAGRSVPSQAERPEPTAEVCAPAEVIYGYDDEEGRLYEDEEAEEEAFRAALALASAPLEIDA